MRRILVTGGTGQLGIELQRQPWPADVQLHAPTRDELDLSRTETVRAIIESGPWDCAINSAAFTAVDAAEDNPADAFMANCQGPAWLAEATGKRGIPLIHISTDYVFPGDSPTAYKETDPVGPVGAYGASKAGGELAVRCANPRSVIVRTAWVVSAHRSNFLKTMLRLAASRDSLDVVADQHGCPTSAADLAHALMIIAERLMSDASAPTGIYHFVNSGEASWYELAQEILRLSAELGGPSAEVRAIQTDAFPTRARRPANSRLSTANIERDFGIRLRHWREAVAQIMSDLDQSNALREFSK